MHTLLPAEKVKRVHPGVTPHTWQHLARLHLAAGQPRREAEAAAAVSRVWDEGAALDIVSGGAKGDGTDARRAGDDDLVVVLLELIERRQRQQHAHAGARLVDEIGAARL